MNSLSYQYPQRNRWYRFKDKLLNVELFSIIEISETEDLDFPYVIHLCDINKNCSTALWFETKEEAVKILDEIEEFL